MKTTKQTYLVLLITLLISVKSIAQQFVLKPYLQNGTPNQMVIMWETNMLGKCYVDWGTSPFALNNTVTSTSIASSGINRLHTAKVTGLHPSTKYYYKVRTNTGTVSTLYNFKTHPTVSSEESLKFVAMSDIQQDNNSPNVFKSVIENGVSVVAKNSYLNGVEDLDAIIIPGDLVVQSNHSSWRSEFFNPSNTITPYVPVYPVPGNHDVIGSGGLGLFLKFFDLPTNGAPSSPEEWWYKDMSNVRLIGLNSSSSSGKKQAQVSWLKQTLSNAENNIAIDFVFVQLHHPHKSELWTPGESDFTGEIIKELEKFTEASGKPSVHFFGHTHGYSRGQSRDHNHLWVNVASAGGKIDYWGEFPNQDYEEFTYTEDEYGFVMLEVEAGNDPKFVLKRYSRGDKNVVKNNTISDQITIKRYGIAPTVPVGISPKGEVSVDCVTLKASAFTNGNNTHQATQWQIVEGCDFSSNTVKNIWKQSMNWYNEVDSQLNDDLTDEKITGLMANKNYCWRVRYRNTNLTWSSWSTPVSITTKEGNNVTENLLLNGGGESGVTNWTGDIESLQSNACNSIPVYQGSRMFAVGGICANEKAQGIAKQTISVEQYTSDIDNLTLEVKYEGFLRSYSGTDKPEMYIEFLNANNTIIGTSASITNKTAVWTNVTNKEIIPQGTRRLVAVLKGTRNGGTDNDSYFDNLSVLLTKPSSCGIVSCEEASASATNCLPCNVSNLIVNNGAENATNNWIGDIESLASGDCYSVEAYKGQRQFAVGGVCANEKDLGLAKQTINVADYGVGIDNGLYTASLSGYLRAYKDGNDQPEMYLEFLNSANSVLKRTNALSNTKGQWIELSQQVIIPVGTKQITVVLKGTRLRGGDNDSYFDELSLTLQNTTCSSQRKPKVKKNKIVSKNKEKRQQNTALLTKEITPVSVYPNPSSGEVYYSVVKQFEKITILDINGKVIKVQKCNEEKGRLDLSDLKIGAYLLMFEGDNTTVSKKIYIQK
ncbi:conserved protein of unknown function precursor containing a type A C-terminal secretion signal [Tenacibaculum sp. 190524A02b]|uniref:fibronectin type III domain-containing protein n=1 Tax=Tenacibaculum vairaonense TaxID=3137860 RepID=UPI0032B238A3